MGITQTVLRSRAARGPGLAARRRPLPRADRPDVGGPRGPRAGRRGEPRGRRPRPPARRDDHAAAHQHLAAATAPASTSSSASSSAAPVVRRGSSPSPAPTRAPATGSRSRCAPTTTGRPGRACPGSSSSRREPGQLVHLSQAEGDFVLPDSRGECRSTCMFISGGSGITPVMSMLRSLQRRTHRGRVTFVHYAQSPDHQIFAARARRGPPLRLRRRRPPAPPGAGRPGLHADVAGAAGARLPRGPDLGCAGPARWSRRSAAAYDGSDALRVEYFRPPATGGGASGGRRSASPAPGSRPTNTGAPAAGAGRGRRAPPGARLPDGHLLLLHGPQDRGDGAPRRSTAPSPPCPTRTSRSA